MSGNKGNPPAPVELSEHRAQAHRQLTQLESQWDLMQEVYKLSPYLIW